jgi:hypothetical protein
VTWYGEQIKCCELADDAQHCSEQFCLFEIARTALIVKPDLLEPSISGMAVPESQVSRLILINHMIFKLHLSSKFF